MPKYLINRSKLLEGVLESEGWESSIDAFDEPDFVMWDANSKPYIPSPESAPLQPLIGKELTKIDNKRQLWMHCQSTMSDMLPVTYLVPDQVSPYSDTTNIWFLKKGHTSGGKDILCGGLGDMLRAWTSMPKYNEWVLQKSVECCLLEGRKWTLRVYVVMTPDKGIWVHKEGLAILHKKLYCDSVVQVDQEVHVDHKGCTRVPFSSLPLYHSVHPSVVKAVQRLFNVYIDILNAAKDPTRYHLFGLDFIVTPAMHPVLIEVNQYPNLSINSGKVGKAIKEELFHDMYDLFIGPAILDTPPCYEGFVKAL